MPRDLTTLTTGLVTPAALAFTVYAYMMGNYVPFLLGITAMMIGAGAWLVASSRRD